MREIKFRAWHKDVNYMSPVGQWNEGKSVLMYVPFPAGDDGSDVDWDGDTVPLDRVELMQFTGLRDKDGKEIYEGDIVKDVSSTDIVFAVQWDESWGGYRLPPEFNEEFEYPITATDLRVIGNIYQNPTLLQS
jgi:uncharacterized phage protein (TIGR01671 family)